MNHQFTRLLNRLFVTNIFGDRYFDIKIPFVGFIAIPLRKS